MDYRYTNRTNCADCGRDCYARRCVECQEDHDRIKTRTALQDRAREADRLQRMCGRLALTGSW